MLHLAPELVDLAAAAALDAPSTWRPTATCASAARCRSAGCPTTSTTTASSATRRRPRPNAASELFAAAVDAFCEALAEIAAFDYRPPAG